MKYRHLFFDLDHTLWDFDANAKLTLNQIYHDMQLASVGVGEFEQFYLFYLAHNEKLWARFRNGFIKAEELRWKRMWHTLLEFRIGDEKLAKQMGAMFLQQLPSRNILFPDTESTLKYLHGKGYRVHLITNGFEDTQWNKIRNAGIDHFFTEVITSEGSNSIKPKREIFEFALRKAGAQQDHSIMIGDSLEADIQGAINAGIDQVFVNHLHTECNLSPTYIVHSLQELQDIF